MPQHWITFSNSLNPAPNPDVCLSFHYYSFRDTVFIELTLNVFSLVYSLDKHFCPRLSCIFLVISKCLSSIFGIQIANHFNLLLTSNILPEDDADKTTKPGSGIITFVDSL